MITYVTTSICKSFHPFQLEIDKRCRYSYIIALSLKVNADLSTVGQLQGGSCNSDSETTL